MFEILYSEPHATPEQPACMMLVPHQPWVLAQDIGWTADSCSIPSSRWQSANLIMPAANAGQQRWREGQ